MTVALPVRTSYCAGNSSSKQLLWREWRTDVGRTNGSMSRQHDYITSSVSVILEVIDLNEFGIFSVKYQWPLYLSVCRGLLPSARWLLVWRAFWRPSFDLARPLGRSEPQHIRVADFHLRTFFSVIIWFGRVALLAVIFRSLGKQYNSHIAMSLVYLSLSIYLIVSKHWH